MRAVAFLLAATMSVAALANPMLPNDVVCEDASAKLIEAGFYKTFDRYVSYKTGKRCLGDFCKLLYVKELSKLKKIIFKNPGSAEYAEALRFIDSQHALDPQLVYDLAKEMQLYWEARYGAGLVLARSANIRAATETGAIAGFVLSVAAAALTKNPGLIGRYNRLFRILYPLAGATAGTIVAETGIVNTIAEKGLPPAPAHLITLGVSQGDVSSLPDELAKEALEMTAALTVGSVAAEALVPRLILAFRAGNAATTPAKLNPYVLLLSIAGTILIEKGIADAYDKYQFDKLKGEFVTLANELADASSSSERAIVLSRAEALTAKAQAMATYLNRPLHEARDEAILDEQKALQDISDPVALSAELKRIETTLSSQIESLEVVNGFIQDREFMSIQVLERLRLKGVSGVNGLSGDDLVMAKNYVGGFEPWLDRGERRAWMTLGTGRREALFSDYVTGLIHIKRSRLASELLGGQVAKNSSRILLQAEQLIRSLGDELIENQADALKAALNGQVTAFPSAWSVP